MYYIKSTKIRFGFDGEGDPPSYIFTSRIRTVSLIIIGTEHYGKKKFDSEGEEAAKIGTEI